MATPWDDTWKKPDPPSFGQDQYLPVTSFIFKLIKQKHACYSAMDVLWLYIYLSLRMVGRGK